MHPNIRQDSHALQWGEVNFGWYTYELLASNSEAEATTSLHDSI